MIPNSAGKVSGVPVMQEVMKFDLTESEIPTPAMIEQSTSLLVLSVVPCIAAEIEYKNIKVRIFNGADAATVQNTLQCSGDMTHAW